MPCMSVLMVLHALPVNSTRAALAARPQCSLCRAASALPWLHTGRKRRRCTVLASPAPPERLELDAALADQDGSVAALESFLKLAELLCIAAAGGLQVAVLLAQLRTAQVREAVPPAEGRRHSQAKVRPQLCFKVYAQAFVLLARA